MEVKAEINSQNQNKYFALYWDQNVLSSSMYGDGGNIYAATMKTNPSFHVNYGKWLLLTPLSLMSDEILIKIYHLHSQCIGYDYTMDFQPTLTMAKHWRDTEGVNWERSVTKYSIIDQYLRRLGFALPSMGLSIDELIEAGWLRLKYQ